MSNQHPHDNEDIHYEHISHSDVHYEDKDLGGRGVILFLVGLVVVCGFLMLVVAGTMRYYYQVASLMSPNPAPISSIPRPPQPPGDPALHFPTPRLQTDDTGDMNKLRDDNNSILNSYGWVDKSSGVVHIPISQAIDAVAKQGLPVRPDVNLPPSADFGSGSNTVSGAGGGTRPKSMR